MQADIDEERTVPAARTDTRVRILEAANELFYSHGIRATSADRIIEQVGITKVTFYRHFRTKSDLVVAYLEGQSAAERAWMQGASRPGEPLVTLRTIAADIGAASCGPDFRGCAFINAAAEVADPADPVRAAVREHRQWMVDFFAGIAAELGARDAESVASQLMMLRDGAMVGGYLGESSTVAEALDAAFVAVVTR